MLFWKTFIQLVKYKDVYLNSLFSQRAMLLIYDVNCFKFGEYGYITSFGLFKSAFLYDLLLFFSFSLTPCFVVTVSALYGVNCNYQNKTKKNKTNKEKFC